MMINLGVSGIVSWNGKVLLGRRSETESLPGQWCTPGGGVNQGESLNNALVREFKEETGLNVVVADGAADFISVQERMLEHRHTVLIFRVVNIIDNNPLLVRSNEFDMLDWFTRDQIMSIVTLPITMLTYKAMREYYHFCSNRIIVPPRATAPQTIRP